MDRKDFEIEEKQIRNQLALIPEQIYDTMIEIAFQEGQLQEIEQEISFKEGNLSNDIAMNPERYGYPLGTTVERFKIKARLLADSELQALNIKKRKIEEDLKSSKTNLECLKHKKEVLMCLINA